MTHFSEDDLFEYFDENVSEELRRKISDHLKLCPSCAELAEECRLLKKALSSVPEPGDSEKFVTNVMTRINPPEAERQSSLLDLFRAWWFPALEVACAVLLFVYWGQAQTYVDTEALLLAGLDEQTSQGSFSSDTIDFSSILGISADGV